MYINLKTISETPKAFQLLNGSWLPKSVLNQRALGESYYELEQWWLNATITKLHKNGDVNQIPVLEAISSMVIRFTDLPENIKSNWFNYNRSGQSVDYEPRLWGNDCFEREH